MQDTTRLELSEAEHKELEKGYRKGTSHCYRMRCLAVLLRAGGKKVSESTFKRFLSALARDISV